VGANNGGLLLLGSASANGQRPHGGIKTVLNDATAYGTADMIFVTRTTTAATTLSEKMRLTKDGKLGLGVSPSYPMHVQWNGQAEFRLHNSSGSGISVISMVAGGQSNPYYLYTDSSRNFIFQDSGTERLTIKSTGAIRYVPMASDPAGASGDLYYSSSGFFKMHNGTAWQQLSRKFSGALSGTGTSFTVTHNLGTRDVTVQVRKSGSTYDLVYTDIQMATTDTVTVVFASSVTGSDYTVTVIG
jgi:hypothetical protein